MLTFMKRVLITGGTGFLGKSILDYRLRNSGLLGDSDITILSRNPGVFFNAYPKLSSRNSISWICGDVRSFSSRGKNFDYIIHAATTIDLNNEKEMYRSMVDGTKHVLEVAALCGAKSILYISSGAVYGPQIAPVQETADCNPATAYGRGKLVAEKLLMESGLDVRIAR
jgi:dTDP-glucose 4,6-dehydratase